MKKKHFSFAMRVLLAFSSLTACYQPIDLTPAEKTEIPWVHCILSPDSTQWLKLGYLVRAGSSASHVDNDAEVLLFEVGKDGHLSSAYKFENVGDGLWRLDMGTKPGQAYQLEVILSGSDTLTATTCMPDYTLDLLSDGSSVFEYVPGNGMTYDHHTDVHYVKEQDDNYLYNTTTDTRTYQGIPSEAPRYFFNVGQDQTKRYRFDHPRFILSSAVDGQSAIWCYKVAWSETRQSWLVEEKLATNQESCTDAFNNTGEAFTQSGMQEALSSFPEVVGKPLHFRYLRFPPGSLSSSDTIAVSGDFSGPHYGDARPGIVVRFEQTEKQVDELMGKPFKDNIFTTGHAGYVNFKFVSDEYDHYLKEVAEYELLHDISTDIVGIYSNTNIYTNIQGGTGIFGAEVDNKLYWSCGVWSY
ncbi:MAG: DUF4249 family protein [Bacteroidales bacterium]|nr:DUF4249 family protein [Bacteroidales bacterium]